MGANQGQEVARPPDDGRSDDAGPLNEAALPARADEHELARVIRADGAEFLPLSDTRYRSTCGALIQGASELYSSLNDRLLAQGEVADFRVIALAAAHHSVDAEGLVVCQAVSALVDTDLQGKYLVPDFFSLYPDRAPPSSGHNTARDGEARALGTLNADRGERVVQLSHPVAIRFPISLTDPKSRSLPIRGNPELVFSQAAFAEFANAWIAQLSGANGNQGQRDELSSEVSREKRRSSNWRAQRQRIEAIPNLIEKMSNDTHFLSQLVATEINTHFSAEVRPSVRCHSLPRLEAGTLQVTIQCDRFPLTLTIALDERRALRLLWDGDRS